MDRRAQALGGLLHEVARLLRTRFDRNARPLRLTRAQAELLLVLLDRRSPTQSALASSLGVAPITLARLLRRLEKAGLVRRLADAGDRRVRRVQLASAALPLIGQVRAVGDRTMAQALEGVSAQDRQRLAAVLGALKVNLLRKQPLGTT